MADQQAEVQRVALITGCGKRNGIGTACALALARAGVAVAVTDIEPQGVKNHSELPEDLDQEWNGLQDLVAQIEREGGSGFAITGDVSLEADAQRMVDEAVAHYGRLDILVNNAGAPHGSEWNDIADVSLDAYEKVMGINARGTFLMARAAIPEMRKGAWGRIVNMSSNNGKLGKPRTVVYSASKAAIIGMTRSMAMDVASQGITANAVCPGRIETSRAIDRRRRADAAGDDGKTMRDRMLPVGRFGGDPEEVAAMVVFLASEAASLVTGQAISVDGGEFPA